MNHTPGPWKIVTYNNGKGMAIEDEKGNDVLTKSNAQFIVTACNAHEELVAALKGCLSWLSSYPGGGAMAQYDKVRKLLTTIEKGA